MGIVSENILYFKLDNIKDNESFMNVIGKIGDSLRNIPDTSNTIMVIKFQTITHDDSTMIPKLEYKDSG